MQLLVDSSVWIDYFNGVASPRTDYLDGLLGRAPVVVGDLVVAEVLRGLADERELELARAALFKFPLYPIGGVELALASAASGRILAGKGAPVPAGIQRLIASFCIQRNLALLHADPAYEPFERFLGLKVPDPAMPM